ncbi:hypothetical protein GCM10027081_37930 [Cupriavidus yeoncheonensis]
MASAAMAVLATRVRREILFMAFCFGLVRNREPVWPSGPDRTLTENKGNPIRSRVVAMAPQRGMRSAGALPAAGSGGF